MKTLLEMITIEMKEAFKAAGYDEELARVTLSNRPDLCEYQCNGAMAGAKKYKKAPIMIANAVVEELADSKYFASAEAVNPGFINLKLAPEVVAEYLNEMAADENLGVEKEKNPKQVLMQKSTTIIEKKHFMQLICYRMDIKDIVQSGNIS